MASAAGGRWLLNEKGALDEARSLGLVEPAWAAEAERILGEIGSGPVALRASLASMRRLVDALPSSPSASVLNPEA